MNTRLDRVAKRVGVVVTTLAVLGGSVVATASSAAADNAEGFEYNVTDGKATIVGCFDTCAESLTIPETLDGFPVTAIGSGAFQNTEVTSLAFSGDSQVTIIGPSAFGNTNLGSLLVPASVQMISNNAFVSSELSSVNFAPGSQLTTIGEEAFLENNIESLKIPSGVTSIGAWAFSANGSLNVVQFYGDKPSVDFSSNAFEGTGEADIYYRTQSSGWEGTDPQDGRHFVGVDPPEITAQPQGGILPVGGSKQLSVTAKSDVIGQGDLGYRWTKDGSDLGIGTSTYVATSPGTYQVEVGSWAGVKLSAPVVVTAQAPEPKPVVKKHQSVKVKLPANLKRNRVYKLPAKTRQGRAIAWRVKGPGRCKINKKKRTITCKRTTAKKKFTLTGAAKATTTLYAYKTTIKRKVR